MGPPKRNMLEGAHARATARPCDRMVSDTVQSNGIGQMIPSNTWFEEVETGSVREADISHLTLNFPVVICTESFLKGVPFTGLGTSLLFRFDS